ncbi:SDR family oxidoreductase [Natronolimnobius sp. AArcel1]|uniref:SDR family NAD(P)-dependent oxidoreductase n=1 Tax=Natronolimnobius sp. AArcel1 TaxID=1679093 RepID=UPI0013EB1464|nr:SDR family oxidoreductase [Natronolimnobius sp. AArcel1]NGM69914.1 SDR family oxidoreductase [Natronolimnobius sp. AArcel1]
MTARIANAVAVVTGGARGIGEATCHRLAEEGATVVVVDRDGNEAQATAEEVTDATGQTALGLEADVGSEAAVESMAATVADRFGRVDILVNNAAIRVDPMPVTEADEASWDRILAVNQKGVAFCSKHCIPLMDDGGAVVNVASVGAGLARPDWAQYDSTKGAVVAMTKDMACDHASDGIRVNAVSPGWVVTDYHLPEDEDEAEAMLEEETTPNPDGPGILKRAAEPREIADAILFLASDEASFITGENLLVDGGATAVGTGLEWDENFDA